MRLAIIGTALLLGLASPAAAQNAPGGAPGVQANTLVASKVPDLGRAPLYFCTLSVTIPAAAASHVASTANGIFYQLSGSTEITTGTASKTLAAGEALFIPGGNHVSIKAVGDGPSRALHFLLVPEASPGSPIATEPAHVDEMFRSPGPIPDLKAGVYQLTLTRRTFPPRTPPSPPRRHSGAALLYVLSGTGTQTVEGRSTENGAGSVVYEPSSLVYRWANRGSEPWTYLAFTLSPDGMPPTVAASSTK